jgi:hypothetical protein
MSFWPFKKRKNKKRRNLVTGKRNVTFGSSGTSRRKSRFVAALTFWNPRD